MQDETTYPRTLRDFVERVEHQYGIKLRVTERGGIRYLESTDGRHRAPILWTELDDEIRPYEEEALCVSLGLPAVDFDLDPPPGE
jgi:hypothetical protein